MMGGAIYVFDGRDGAVVNIMGWTPAVSEFVSEDVEYIAQWDKEIVEPVFLIRGLWVC